MLFDILIVFVVSLISSLCLCTTSLHALPISASSSAAHYIHSPPSADLSSSLRLFHHQPVPSVDYDLGGDISEMLIGESNELSPMNNQDDDDDSSAAAAAAPPSSFASSLDASNEPLDVYLQPMPSESLSRKLFLSAKHHLLNRNGEEDEKDHQRKRFSSPSISGAPSLPTQLNLHSAYADPSNSNSVANINRLSESTRLTPSLQLLVETNPFARAWLTLLLQKVMEEQHVPYIFKYGRRRK